VAKARLTSDPGFYTLAEQTAKAMMATAPTDPAALLLLGHTYHAMHRFADAEAIARQLTSQRDFVFDHALLGDALMEQGRLHDAVIAYQKMVDLKPCLQTYSRVAHMRWLKGDTAGAIQASRLAISGGSPREPEPTAWAYARLAYSELQAGNLEPATEATELAAQFLPDYPPALLMRGRLLLAQNKHAEAVEPLRRAAELNPLPDYLWTLADALRAASQLPEAEKVEAQLAASGAMSDARTFALFLASRGDKPEKALELATAELQSRQDIFTHDAVAWAQLVNGRVDEARQHIDRALAEGTQDARLFYHAGAIAAAAGDEAGALEFFAKARRIGQMLLPSERAAVDQRTAALLNSESQISAN
jgi:tetratricopeptide (TPR) repeat protein